MEEDSGAYHEHDEQTKLRAMQRWEETTEKA